MEKFFLIVPLLVIGCVVSPDNTPIWGTPGKAIEFYGVATVPNEIIEVQALDTSDGEWVTVATTLSASDVTYTVEGMAFYEYATTVTLDYTSVGSDNCFYGYSSVAGCISNVLPKLRAYQPNLRLSRTGFEQQCIRCMETANKRNNNAIIPGNSSGRSENMMITMQWNW